MFAPGATTECDTLFTMFCLARRLRLLLRISEVPQLIKHAAGHFIWSAAAPHGQLSAGCHSPAGLPALHWGPSSRAGYHRLRSAAAQLQHTLLLYSLFSCQTCAQTTVWKTALLSRLS